MLTLLPKGIDRRLKTNVQKQIQPAIVEKVVGDKPRLAWVDFARTTKIRSGKKLVPFDPYQYQIELEQCIEKHYGTVVVKSRQLGLTEFCSNWMLSKAKDDPAFLGVVFSKSQEDTKNIAKRVRLMIASRNDIQLDSNSLQDLQLKDGGRLVFRPSTKNAGRGLESVSAILFDECAFVPDIEELYSAAIPSTEMLGDAARIIILSTPNGQQGFYWQRLNEGNGDRDILKMCDAVRRGNLAPIQHWTDDGGWCKFIVHWRAHPIYSRQENYLEQQKIKKRLTEAQVSQEYDLGFESSSHSVFAPELVERGKRGQYKPPQPGHRYIAGIDPNLGGDDFFTTYVIDITSKPFELVAEYHQNRKTKDYNLIQSLGVMEPYKPVIASIETNNGGILYLDEYTKLKPSWRWEGVCTTQQSKLANTDRLVLLLERDHFIYPVDSSFAVEAPHFIEVINGKSRSRNAESGWHDDGVMAGAIAFANLDAAGFNIADMLAAMTR